MLLLPVTGSFLFAISAMLFVDASTKFNQAYYMREPFYESDNVRTINEIRKRKIPSNQYEEGEIYDKGNDHTSTTVPNCCKCQSVTTSELETRKMKKDRSDNFNYDNFWDFLYAVDLLENDDKLQRDGNREVDRGRITVY